jgi:hypothetical protein
VVAVFIGLVVAGGVVPGEDVVPVVELSVLCVFDCGDDTGDVCLGDAEPVHAAQPRARASSAPISAGRRFIMSSGHRG